MDFIVCRAVHALAETVPARARRLRRDVAQHRGQRIGVDWRSDSDAEVAGLVGRAEVRSRMPATFHPSA